MASDNTQLLLDEINASGLWLSQPFKNFSQAINKYNPDMSTTTYNELVSIIRKMKNIFDPKNELNKNSTDEQKTTVIFSAISSMSNIEEICQFCSLALFGNKTSITVDNNFHTILILNLFFITVDKSQKPEEAIWMIQAPNIPGTITYITEYGTAPNDVSIEFDAVDAWYHLTSGDLPVLPDVENGLYKFLGWREKGTDDILAEGSQINDNSTNHVVTLEAVWQQTNTQLINIRGLRHFAQRVSEGIQAREKISNKVTSLSASSTDIQYPSAKVVYNELNGKAPKNSPAFIGTPTAPTAAAGTNTTQIATTAFVNTAINNNSINWADITDAKVYYGTCSSSANNREKLVSCATFNKSILENGDIFIITFQSQNWVNNPQIRINQQVQGYIYNQPLNDSRYKIGEFKAGTYIFLVSNNAFIMLNTNKNDDYAPKDSPHLYGTPMTPTPDDGDNSLRIANTEFITNLINNNNNLDTILSDINLT